MSAWIVSPHHISQLVYGAIRLGLVEPADATKVGRMLTNANKKSIRARYGEYDEGAARVQTYWYRQPGKPISDVSLMKQVACYDYQTCEFYGYERSRAKRFVKSMWRVLAARVDTTSQEYADAPWGV